MRYMSSLAVALFVGLVAAAVPHPASALQVDITYQLAPNNINANTTAYLGGSLPAGGTAKVRWAMSSTFGAFTSGPGSVISLNITGTGGSLAVTPFAWTGAYIYPTTSAYYAVGGIAPHPQFANFAQMKAYTTGEVIFSGYIGPVSGPKLVVWGSEIDRVLVPEPSTASLLALGLCGVAAAGRTVWRRKGRRSA
jgi:hypothetical protein